MFMVARVIGIILSGLLNDGTSGLSSIKRLGGVTIIQDPEEAIFPEMPENALEFVEVDHILPVAQMAPLLQTLTAQPRSTPELTAGEMELMRMEVVIAANDNAFEMGIMKMVRYRPLHALNATVHSLALQKEKQFGLDAIPAMLLAQVLY